MTVRIDNGTLGDIHARIDNAREVILERLKDLENPLWIQILIGIVSSLGAELITAGIDQAALLAHDRREPPAVVDYLAAPAPDPGNFFDR